MSNWIKSFFSRYSIYLSLYARCEVVVAAFLYCWRVWEVLYIAMENFFSHFFSSYFIHDFLFFIQWISRKNYYSQHFELKIPRSFKHHRACHNFMARSNQIGSIELADYKMRIGMQIKWERKKSQLISLPFVFQFLYVSSVIHWRHFLVAIYLS